VIEHNQNKVSAEAHKTQVDILFEYEAISLRIKTDISNFATIEHFYFGLIQKGQELTKHGRRAKLKPITNLQKNPILIVLIKFGLIGSAFIQMHRGG
jgi:hypothetical protein